MGDREIRFRAWTNEMNYYFTVAKIDFHKGIIEEQRGRDYNGKPLFRKHPIGWVTLEQYTGMEDKNGVEIYEGDIVSCTDAIGGKSNTEIKFTDGCFEIEQSINPSAVYRDYLKCLTVNHAVEIIGNIHENPDLLS